MTQVVPGEQHFNRIFLKIVTAAGVYGKLQQAALSTRELKMVNPELYSVLYKNSIEMLYFLIEKRISESIRVSTA